MEKIRNFSLDEFKELLLAHFKNIYDLELLILKGHILTEFTINCHLENLSNKSKANFFKERFTYSTKIKLFQHFGDFGSRTDDFVDSLKLLNKIRNDIAHTLMVNEVLINQFISSVEQMVSEDFINPDYELRLKFSMATGYLCGEIFADYRKKNED